jgi:hypothetical protein
VASWPNSGRYPHPNRNTGHFWDVESDFRKVVTPVDIEGVLEVAMKETAVKPGETQKFTGCHLAS